MFKKIKEEIQTFVSTDVHSDKDRIHAQYLLVMNILSIVSFFMMFLNIATHWYAEAVVTFIFGVCCVVSAYIERHAAYKPFGRVPFIIEMVLLFTALIIIGEPDGFSPIWILLFPTCGFLLFRMRHGSWICIIQETILILLLWTPLGDKILLYDYSLTFRMRFPIVFLAFSFVGIMFEKIQLRSRKDLEKAKEAYEYMYNHDALTGVYNRYGFNSSLDGYVAERNNEAFAFGILDFDHFKNINDRYGHDNGDIILKEIAKRVSECVGEHGIVCRWGGEEFSILFKEKNIEPYLDKLMEIARSKITELNGEEIIQTFSIGMVKVNEGVEVDAGKLVKLADNALYKAKADGRNCCRVVNYSDSIKE